MSATKFIETDRSLGGWIDHVKPPAVQNEVLYRFCIEGDDGGADRVGWGPHFERVKDGSIDVVGF